MKRFLNFLFTLALLALIVLFFVAPCFGQTADDPANQYSVLPTVVAAIIVALHPLVIQQVKKLFENIRHRYLIALILSAIRSMISASGFRPWGQY